LTSKEESVPALSEHQPIRTYKPRRGRITARQARALERDDAHLLIPDHQFDLTQLFGGLEVICEIGFGTGITTAAMAKARPDLGFLAIDVHTPGIGDLIARIREEQLSNIYVVEGDAIQVLAECIARQSLRGVRSFFPDPWPKARHHKRRLVQPERVELIASRVRENGTWDIATDWLPYADHIESLMTQMPQWHGGKVARPDWRPLTHYESLGLDQGREISDFRYVRTQVPCITP